MVSNRKVFFLLYIYLIIHVLCLCIHLGWAKGWRSPHLFPYWYFTPATCHSLSQQKIRADPQCLNSASQGLRGHVLADPIISVIRVFSLWRTLGWSCRQYKWLWFGHMQTCIRGLSSGQCAKLCFPFPFFRSSATGGSNCFKTCRAFQDFVKLLKSLGITWKGQIRPSQTAYLIFASPLTLCKINFLFPCWKKSIFICTFAPFHFCGFFLCWKSDSAKQQLWQVLEPWIY